MTFTKKLSIIIPIYNKEQYLPECLNSLNHQGFDSSVEILLIDDGSQDGSLQICKTVAAVDYHYRVIHQENQGIAAARNTGLAHAEGKYVAWVDPDDYITDDWWSTIKIELEASPDMIFFDMIILENNQFKEVNYDKSSREIAHQELCEQMAISTRFQSHLWSKIILRKFFDQRFSTKYSFCEDFALLHHVLWNVRKCRYVHKALYVYRMSDGSICHDDGKVFYNNRLLIKLLKKRYRFYKKHNMMIPYDGVWTGMNAYCNWYKINCEKYENGIDKSQQDKQRLVYKKCLGIIRKNFFSIIRSPYLGIKSKILLLITAMECNSLINIYLYFRKQCKF